MVKFDFNEYFILKPANIVSSHDGELTENLIEKASETEEVVKIELIEEVANPANEIVFEENKTNIDINTKGSSQKFNNSDYCETIQNSLLDKKSYSCESILIANLSIDEDSNKRNLFKSPVAVTSNQKYEDEFNFSKNHQGKLNN